MRQNVQTREEAPRWLCKALTLFVACLYQNDPQSANRDIGGDGNGMLANSAHNSSENNVILS